MSRPKTPAPDWQAKLYERHAGWIAGKPIHMAVGDGWADVVSRLFDRIGAALAGESVPTTIAIIDVKEKYGELRADFLAPVGPDTEAAIDRAVLPAELRSEVTCDECGEPGKLRSTLGSSPRDLPGAVSGIAVVTARSSTIGRQTASSRRRLTIWIPVNHVPERVRSRAAAS